MIFTPVLPIWMLVLLCCALVAFAFVQFVRRRRDGGSWHWLVRAAMVIVIFGMALRPGLPTNLRPPAASGDVDVYFVVDTTSSMAAEDFGPEDAPRLAGVRDDLMAMTAELSGARYTLITFDAVTVQRLPLTTDSSAITSGVKALNQEITAYSAGSSISQPVEFLHGVLEQDALAHPERQRVVFYLGDGEQTVAEPPGSFAELAEFIDQGAVLGYGTAEGGPMKRFSGYTDDGVGEEYITAFGEGGSEPAISTLDEPALQTIAAELGVDYVHRGAGDSVEPVVDGITVSNISSDTGASVQAPEFYWLLAIVFGLLALTELPLVITALRELRAMSAREHPGAQRRRRGETDGS
ncbi:VWA domain-containing protein [Okibacterium endophyticum]